MKSICEEHHYLTNLSGLGRPTERVRQRREYKGKNIPQTCNCESKSDGKDSNIFSKGLYFGRALNPQWKFKFKADSFTHHHHTCPLSATSAKTAVARFLIRGCGRLLAGAVEASISMTIGAGGLSISHHLRCAHVISRDSPAFQLVDLTNQVKNLSITSSKVDLDALLNRRIQELEFLFRAGKASPYDVDLQGNTLLHVRIILFLMRAH